MQLKSRFVQILIGLTFLLTVIFSSLFFSTSAQASSLGGGSGHRHHQQGQSQQGQQQQVQVQNQQQIVWVEGGFFYDQLRYPIQWIPNEQGELVPEDTNLSRFCVDRHLPLPAHAVDVKNPRSWKCGDITLYPDDACYWAYGPQAQFFIDPKTNNAWGWRCLYPRIVNS